MTTCSVVTAQPRAQPVTKSRRKAFPLSVQRSHKDCQVDRRAGSKELLPVKGSFPIRPLTICVSPDSFLGLGEVGSPRSMPPTGRATPWDGYIDLVSRPPACNALQQRTSFSCRFVYQNRPSPHPRIGCNIMNGSDPEARQVVSTVLEFRPAESPISSARGHIAHVGMIRLNRQLHRSRGALIIFRVHSARQGTVQAREPLIPSVIATAAKIGYGGPFRGWGSCTRCSSVGHLVRTYTSIKPHLPP